MGTQKKIPVLLITGFLGSGKTTLLRHLAEKNPDKRMVFLVNEFAESDVDGEILRSSHSSRPTHSVVGGSLFCECKAGEFVRVMKERIAPIGLREGLDALVIETSGIADPEAIGKIMSDFGLSDFFEVAQIVSVVSPKRFASLVENLKSVEAQIRTSDVVIINKIDLASEGELDAVEAKIRSINSKAHLVRCERSRVDLSMEFAVRAALPLGNLSTCESNPFTTETIRLESPVSLSKLQPWFEALPPQIMRLKGHVLTHEGWFSLSRSVGEQTLLPAAVSSASELVLIVLDEDEIVLSDQLRLLYAIAHDEKRAS